MRLIRRAIIQARNRVSNSSSLPYVAKAVHFNGSTGIGPTNLSAGLAPDSPTGMLVFWVNATDMFQGGGGALLNDSNLGICDFVQGGPANGLGNDFLDIASANRFSTGAFDPDTYTAPVPSGTWTCVQVSWNMNYPAGSRLFQVYYGDAEITPVIEFDTGAAFSIGYSDPGDGNTLGWQLLGSNNALGNDQGLAFLGDAADYQLWCGNSFVDLTMEENRRLFVDAGGKPVNPAVAAASIGQQTYLLSGDASSFATNKGGGEATSVLYGSLTNASTSPSD